MNRSVLFLLVIAGLILALGGALWFTSASTGVEVPATARSLRGPSFAVPDKAVRPEVKAMRQALDDELGATQGKRGKGKRKARAAAASNPDAPRPVPTATARQAAAGLGPTLSSHREPPKAMSAGQQVTRSPRGGGGKGKRRKKNAAKR